MPGLFDRWDSESHPAERKPKTAIDYTWIPNLA